MNLSCLYYTALTPIKMPSASKPRLLLIGSSGHASVLVDAVELAGSHTVAGYLDDTVTRGTIRRSHPVLGRLSDIASICADQLIEDLAIAIGDNWWRRKVHRDLAKKCPQLNFPVIRHPSALVARMAEVGQGSVIFAGSHVGPG